MNKERLSNGRQPNYRSIDGNTAAVNASYAYTDITLLYPITPASSASELSNTLSTQGKLNIFDCVTNTIQMQSEGGVAAALNGASSAGSLTSTATCSQGLLLMVPTMFKLAGELHPTVFHVSSRAVAGQAMDIFCDHSDVMACRQTGFTILSSNTVQEVADLAVVSHLAAIKSTVPVMHFYDGMRISHEVNKVDVMTTEEMAALYDHDALMKWRERRSMNTDRPDERGGVENADIYWQFLQAAEPYFKAVPEIIQGCMDQVAQLTGRQYKLYEYYGAPDAEHVVIMMGSGVNAACEISEYLNNQGGKVGCVVVRLFRPFSAVHLDEAIPASVKTITVLDKTHEPGSNGEPLYLDVCAALAELKRHVKVIPGRYGLGGKDFTPTHALAVYQNAMKAEPKLDFNIGITDDLLNSSLELPPVVDPIPETTTQCLVYALGADGSVGAGKNAIKIIGDNTDNFAQGYFQYDAKKSGGFTVSNMRFGPDPITSEYCVRNADYIACHNPTFIHHFAMLKHAKQGANFVLNITHTDFESLNKELPSSMKREIANKNINFYVIDAFDVAEKAGLPNRINMVLNTVFFKLSEVLPLEEAIALLKKAIIKTYGHKGDAIVEANMRAVDEALAHLIKVDVPENWKEAPIEEVTKFPDDVPEWFTDVILPCSKLEGENIPVSKFKDVVGGVIPTGTSKYEKRGVTLKIPQWESGKCVQCNLCSTVCAHAAIRPVLATDEDIVPENIEMLPLRGKAPGDFKYRIQVSPLDCMGCTVCTTACPKSALSMVDVDEDPEQILNWEKTMELPAHGEEFPLKVLRDVQFHQPLLEFSGACAGCAETQHAKLLTQMFGDRLYIADACGCSLVWGGMYPASAWGKNEFGRGPSFLGTLFEDTAEVGAGLTAGLFYMRDSVIADIRSVIAYPEEVNVSTELIEAFKNWLAIVDKDEYIEQIVADAVHKLLPADHPHPTMKNIIANQHLLVRPVPWILGGDGWAYDIGFGGVDQVLNMAGNINILVMDTEVYSNTGGQVSKATPRAGVARFAAAGKATGKKSLGLHAMTIGNVYVASVAIGANKVQTLKAFQEAEAYDGPSVVIAYCPCINHGIRKGMTQSDIEAKLAVQTGYWPLYRYNPDLIAKGKNPLIIDSKPASKDLSLFLQNEVRFHTLMRSQPERAAELQKALQQDIDQANGRLLSMKDYYESMLEHKRDIPEPVKVAPEVVPPLRITQLPAQRQEVWQTVDGNQAALLASYYAVDMVFQYPITPSSPMCEYADIWRSKGTKNIFNRVVGAMQMQSEGGVAGALHGAACAGALTATFTCSQGLMLMVPEMFKLAGEMLPTVFHVASRAVAGQAMNIFCDHSDVMACRQTGFSMLSSNTVQEVMDLAVVSHLATVKTCLPIMHFFDGMRISHEVNKINIITPEEIAAMYDFEALAKYRKWRSMNNYNPSERGGVENADIYWQFLQAAEPYYNAIPDIIQSCMDQVSKLTGRSYNLFDYVGAADAEQVVVMMGAGSTAVEEAINLLNSQGRRIGLIKVRLFRPFSNKHLLGALPASVKTVTVIDKTHEPGAIGEPLYLSVNECLYENRPEITVVPGRYGVGGKDFTATHAVAVINNMIVEEPKRDFNVGILDDVLFSHLELPDEVDALPETCKQAVVFALGSDGTVGAGKNAIKIIGDNTTNYAQGYFQYDAKKSGGFTVSNMRFGPDPITSEYCVRHADYVACHNPAFVHHFNMLKFAKPGSAFVLNTPNIDFEELDKELPGSMKRAIAAKNVDFYVIDAFTVAENAGLPNRINMVMNTVFFKLSQVIPIEEAIALLKKAIVKTYGHKGDAIVEANMRAVDEALANLIKVDVPESWATTPIEQHPAWPEDTPEWFTDVILPCSKLEGDSIPVSKFHKVTGGVIPTGTSKYEKRGVALKIPVWISDNCVQCNLCTSVCAHSAIRPFLVAAEDEVTEEFNTLKFKGKQDFQYRIQVSPLDCMQCTVCTTICPKDALDMQNVSDNLVEVQNWETAVSLPAHGEKFPRKVLRDVQFHNPYLEFSGACAGCVETSTASLICRNWGDRLYIADACGCSLVWGGMYPASAWGQDEFGRGPAFNGTLFEAAAEVGLGMTAALRNRRERLVGDVAKLLKTELPAQLKELLTTWLETADPTREMTDVIVKEVEALIQTRNDALLQAVFASRHLFIRPVPWIFGGDGWAYDIGYGGVDQVLNMPDNTNILVMDTEVYSNTGGQVSKATPRAGVARFAAAGKVTSKKDLGLLAMNIGNVYVASIALGANKMQALRAIQEAEAFDGPSIVIAYCPCINHGIRKGMGESDIEGKLAVETGYWPLYRYNPDLVAKGKNPLIIDHRAPSKPLTALLDKEVRFHTLKRSDPERAAMLQEELEHDTKMRQIRLAKMKDMLDPNAKAEESASAPICVVYGSETGNAEGIARTVAKKLGTETVIPMAKTSFKAMWKFEQVVLVTSTVGDGEFPAEAESLYTALSKMKNLSKFKFGVFGLGDSNYELFCKCADLFKEAMENAKATCVSFHKGDESKDGNVEAAIAAFVTDLEVAFLGKKAPAPKAVAAPKAEVDIEDVNSTDTICPYCGVGCGVTIQTEDGKIVKCSGNKKAPVNKGRLCIKGLKGMDFLDSEDRLKTPLIRQEDGSFKEASWEEAITLISERFAAIKAEHGPDAIAGLSSARCTNEDNYAFQKFMRTTVGTNNVDHCARLCHASTVVGLRNAFGSGHMTNTFADLEEAKCILVIGSNTTEAHPVGSQSVTKAVKSGAKLIVVDPREINLAKKADLYLQIRPGTDIAFLNAMLRELIVSGLVDEQFIANKTTGFEETREHVMKYTLEYASEITGLAAEDIRTAAHWYGENDPASIIYCMGLTQHTFGTNNVRCIANLALATGNLGKPGAGVNPLRGQMNVQGACDLGALPNVLPGYLSVADTTNPEYKIMESVWESEIPKEVGLTITEMFHAITDDKKVKGMYIMGENPVVSDANANHVKHALDIVDFLVVQDIFMTPTAEKAHVVLPAAALAEKFGTATNTERRVQPIVKAHEAPGVSKPDWEIVSMIAKAMGKTNMNYTKASEITNEIAETTALYRGVLSERVDELKGIHIPCWSKYHPGTPILHIDWFRSTSGKGSFCAVEVEDPAELPNNEYPFVLSTGRILAHYHTGTMTRRCATLNKMAPNCFVEISNEDCAKLGVENGEMVRVSSRRGTIECAVKVKNIAPGVVFVPFHFQEAAANDLTIDVVDPQAKIPQLKFCAVKVEKL
ncbi:hypothetical protein PCE1_000018 [Barthelona sp. PCE]